METIHVLDGVRFADMIQGGYANLRTQASRINDLNVFPIPDGDTGDNMLLTMLGGVDAGKVRGENLSETSRKIADGMLLSARGNSGVILSQFFDGIAAGFQGIEEADSKQISAALKCGVAHAYKAVLTPTEGTVLTVAREAAEYAERKDAQTPYALIQDFIEEAKRSLDKTPDLLPVLKKAGVVDSGGAGLVCIMEGMARILNGEVFSDDEAGSLDSSMNVSGVAQDIDISLFDENSVLEFGYCTELLVRLQTAKINISEFDITEVTDYLQQIGDSVAAFRTGTIVKIHVHTMTPDKVLSFCQKYGEFLKIKIENMSLQHNNSALAEKDEQVEEIRPHSDFAIVAVCSGEGVETLFKETGADIVISGGQSMNPPTEDFIAAFKKANADTIYVLPNNSNIILTARQAASMYQEADIRVIESRTIGDGFAALSMYDANSGDPDVIEEELISAMQGVLTAEISQAVRDTQEIKSGEYIGFVGKNILADDYSRFEAACKTIDKLGIERADLCMIIYGKDANEEEASRIQSYVNSTYPDKEAFTYDGKQDIYDYIIILQ